MSIAEVWAYVQYAVDEFIRWSHLVINGALIAGFVRGTVDRWRKIPPEQLAIRFIDAAQKAFLILASIAVFGIALLAPKPPPPKPIPCEGLTIARVDASGELRGDITPGRWVYQPDAHEILGPHGKRFDGRIDIGNWCFTYPP